MLRSLSALAFAMILAGDPSPGRAAPVPPRTREPDRVFTLGGGGWVLERFGRDVAILRAAVTPVSGAPGLLVLSCGGRERRWRLDLSQSTGIASSAGDLLLRPSGAPGRASPALQAPIRIEGGRVLTVAEERSTGDGFVPGFLRLLKQAPTSFDLLIQPAGTLNRDRLFGSVVTPTVFALVVRPVDRVAFDDFLGTCTTAAE